MRKMNLKEVEDNKAGFKMGLRLSKRVILLGLCLALVLSLGLPLPSVANAQDLIDADPDIAQAQFFSVSTIPAESHIDQQDVTNSPVIKTLAQPQKSEVDSDVIQVMAEGCKSTALGAEYAYYKGEEW